MAAPITIGSAQASGGSSNGDDFFSGLGNTLVGQGLSVIGSLFGNDMARKNAEFQQKLQKDLLDYQWKNFSSPKAQATSLAEAGINPAVAFGQGSMSHSAQPSMGSVSPISPRDIGLSGADFANSILALSQAKKAGSEAAGQNLDNIIKRTTLNEQINAASLANKWTDEQTNLVIQQAYNLQGLNTKIQEEINLLRKQGTKLDFENEHWEERFKNEMRQYADKHNIDEQTFKRMEQELPFVLSKLESEANLLDIEEEMQGDFRTVNESLGVVGQVLKFISMFIKKR